MLDRAVSVWWIICLAATTVVATVIGLNLSARLDIEKPFWLSVAFHGGELSVLVDASFDPTGLEWQSQLKAPAGPVLSGVPPGVFISRGWRGSYTLSVRLPALIFGVVALWTVFVFVLVRNGIAWPAWLRKRNA
jgi:hypothetical protein